VYSMCIDIRIYLYTCIYIYTPTPCAHNTELLNKSKEGVPLRGWFMQQHTQMGHVSHMHDWVVLQPWHGGYVYLARGQRCVRNMTHSYVWHAWCDMTHTCVCLTTNMYLGVMCLMYVCNMPHTCDALCVTCAMPRAVEPRVSLWLLCCD